MDGPLPSPPQGPTAPPSRRPPGTVSFGCVRLTNWDALFLADQVEPGTPVCFRNIPPGRQEHPSPVGTPLPPTVQDVLSHSFRTCKIRA